MTCHAAIVSREMQIPCIVGTKSCGQAVTEMLQDGAQVTVDAKNGVVYQGDLAEQFNSEKETTECHHAEYYAPTATRVMMNLGDPELAEKYAELPVDGIGLMREEFLWTTYIHDHPLYLIETGHPEKVVDMLADGIAKVARAITPRPMVLRFSDFKSGDRSWCYTRDCP